MQDAWRSMRKIRKTEVQAARDLYYAYVQFKEESKVRPKRRDRPARDLIRQIIQGKTFFSRFTELFTIPRCRRANYAASAVMLAQQLCGINIMAFYRQVTLLQATRSQAHSTAPPSLSRAATVPLRRSTHPSVRATATSVRCTRLTQAGFGAINFLFAFPAVFTIDTFGRRSLLLLTFREWRS